jgi:hypothetical protein
VNRPDLPVTLPRARIEVDTDGHLTVSVDGQPWQPPTQGTTLPASGLPLGRSDVPWAQQQIADDMGTPVLVEILDNGQPYSDIVDPNTYRPAGLDGRVVSAEAEVGRYAPGEPVAITVVVGRTHADEHGHVHYRLPAALTNRTVLVHGEVSGITLPLGRAPLAQLANETVETPSRPSAQPRSYDMGRHQPGSGQLQQPAGPVPAPRVTPDDGLGAL